MTINFVIYIVLLCLSIGSSLMYIGAAGGWRFGNGVFFNATFFAILAIFAFRFMTDWAYIKPKSFVILGCITFLPDFFPRIVVVIMALIAGTPFNETLVIWKTNAFPFLLECTVFTIDIICAIWTAHENKALKSNPSV